MNPSKLFGIVAVWLMLPCMAPAQNAPATDAVPAAESAPATATAAEQLPVEQARLADRFKRLEEVLSRLAEYSAATDPRRAKLLREAIAQSREQDLSVRFESIVKLLEEERLSVASNNQVELQQELDGLLNLLLRADRDRELSSERDRVREYLREVSRLIRMQKGVRARTEGGDTLPELSKDQERIAAETGKLSGAISQSQVEPKQAGDAKSADSEPSDDGKRSDEANKPKDDATAPPDSEAPPADAPKAESADKAGESQDAPGESKGAPNPSQNEPKSQPPKGQPAQPGESPSQPSESQGKPGESPSQPGQPSPGQSGEPSQDQSDQPEPNDNQPPQPSPEPADRAAERLRTAQQQMDEARQQLEDAERKGAANYQRDALRALEQAKAELERVLRQLREEELERTLTQLAARFRKMLELQNQVYEATVRLNEVPVAERDHEDEIDAARWSRQEMQIVHEADKALLLLREEGSSVAFPETVEQMRDDMRQVAERLAAFKVEEITQGLEQDIIAALEETIAALDKASKELEKSRTPPGQQPTAGEPPEPPLLVDQIAELKMIRSLQMRINSRTQRYGKLIVGEQAETTELLQALEQLSERQQRVHQATADLAEESND